MRRNAMKTGPGCEKAAARGARSERGVALLSLVLMGSAVLILASAMIPVTMSIVDYQKRTRTRAKLQLFQTALQNYFGDTGQFPAPTAGPGSGASALALARLYLNVDNLGGWQGPYLPGPATDYLYDEWNTPFVYRSGTGVGIGPITLVLSNGRNLTTDSDLTAWDSGAWASSSDDVALKVDTTALISRLRDKNLNLLLGYKAGLYNANPSTPPAAVVTALMLDAWGHPMVYRKCHNFAGVLFSYGSNGVDDSNAGANICLFESAGGDDMFVPLEWDISANATGLVWKGGYGSNPNICQSYQLKIYNLYPNDLTVKYRDTSNGWPNTKTIPGGGNVTINGVAPDYNGAWAVLVSYGAYAVEGFSPILLDLNGDCIVSKLYGYQY